MKTLRKSGFVRHFLSGFALGAVGLVAVQVVHAEPVGATDIPVATTVVMR